nr:CoB--CoM heterodisulfide reductase iron-sulfur subunit A family protein [Desulfobacterales bacterium]
MLEKPRYIDMDKCIACGTCAEKCPRKVVNEFNMGLDKRKAAYVKYSQTVPLKYAIDAANCIFFKKGKCKACEKFCPTKAVNFAQEAKTHVINVGSIILAPGFESFDPTPYENYSYKDSPNCITSMEFERVLSASGPYAGHLVRPGDKKEPRRIAFIQCVGSRDTHHSNNGYCSSVCCMYAIKEALVAMEHSKEPLETSIFYMDMRTYGKDFEKYYNQAQEKGVRFIRARVYNISPADETGDLIVRYATQQGDINEDVFDLVVLSTGLVVPQSVRDLASVIGIELNRYKFAKTSSFSPVSTSVPGIYACGAFQDPKDIPYSVMEASAASSAATSKLAGVKGTLVNEKTFPEERDISGEPIRIGVFVCNCGVNIGGVVNVPEVAEYAKRLPNVVYVQENLFSCSQDAQDKLREVIIENNLNRVVVAACSPRTHEPLFQETLKSCGINKYLFEMTNIRDQNSWVHQNEPEAATEKAKDSVRMAVAKASLLFPLKEVKLGITPAALVV